MNALQAKATSYTDAQIEDAIAILAQGINTTPAEEIALGVLVGEYIDRLISGGLHPSKAEAKANALLGQG